MSNLSQGCPEEKECKCYKDPDSWIWVHFNKLKGDILNLQQGNYELWAGNDERNTDKKCPLLDRDEEGWCEQYAFEQLVLSEVSEMQGMGLYAVPSPSLYENKTSAWFPDLVLFNEKEERIWVVETTTIGTEQAIEVYKRQKLQKVRELLSRGLFPKGWELEIVFAILTKGMNRQELVREYFKEEIEGHHPPSMVGLITGKARFKGKLEREKP